MVYRIEGKLSFLSFHILRQVKRFSVYRLQVKTIIHLCQMQTLTVFHRKFRLDDAFLDTAELVDVEHVNEPNAEEAEVVGHDMPDAVMAAQKVVRYSPGFHQLRNFFN